MKRNLIIVGMIFFCKLFSFNVVTPKPFFYKQGKKKGFSVNEHTKVYYQGKELKKVAEYLVETIKLYHAPLDYSSYKEGERAIILKVDKDIEMKKEGGYILEICRRKISLIGNSPKGVFYAIQTLRQLSPIDIEQAIRTRRFSYKSVLIKDQPKYKWRGMMLDVCRHFFDKEKVKSFIRLMALHKMSVLHLHLTEDQGWRIEIKKYPKLTSIGAYRDASRITIHGPRDGLRYGGYFTQEDLKEIVAYAKKHYIDVMPEIDFPGHVQALLTAYPKLGNDDIPNYNPKVRERWGVSYYSLSPKPETFKFIKNVLNEVMDIFPFPYIHTGGDEVVVNQWKESAYAKKYMKKKGIKNVHNLQNEFTVFMKKVMAKRGRTMLGWNEIATEKAPNDVIPMYWAHWKGGGKLTPKRAIEKGFKIIMAPTSHTYFDYYQERGSSRWDNPTMKNDLTDIPIAISGFLPLKKVYSFSPKKTAGIDSENILGGQAQLWSEYMTTWSKVLYMTLPRMSALAEALWIEDNQKNYSDFKKRLGYLKKKTFYTWIQFSSW